MWAFHYCRPVWPYAALLPNSTGCYAQARTVKGPYEPGPSTGSMPFGRMFAGKDWGPLDLAMGTALTVRHLILPLAAIVVMAHAGQASAQGAFPAPLPGQAAPAAASPFPPVGGGSPFPPVGGAAPSASFPAQGAAPIGGPGFGGPPSAGPSDDCMNGFIPLREDVEKRAKAIRVASERHATPDEACKLFGNFGQAELKMLRFVESRAAKCGIPAQVATQLRPTTRAPMRCRKRSAP